MNLGMGRCMWLRGKPAGERDEEALDELIEAYSYIIG